MVYFEPHRPLVRQYNSPPNNTPLSSDALAQDKESLDPDTDGVNDDGASVRSASIGLNSRAEGGSDSSVDDVAGKIRAALGNVVLPASAGMVTSEMKKYESLSSFAAAHSRLLEPCYTGASYHFI